MDKNIEFLHELDAEIIKTELIAFLDSGEFDSYFDFTEQFVDFIKEDLSRA